MNERMFGLETEYAITGIKGHKGLNRELITSRFMEVAGRCLVHLPDIQSSGMFLANGSRLYIDCGQHPELAIPECTNPWDAVRYLKAGERIIDTIIGQLSSDFSGGTEIFCSSCNVDYLENTTWGCHESYLHRCETRVLSKHIIPHLVTRTVFTGAGGFEPSSAGFRFTLSPRASYISHVVSDESTGDRGIYHTKDESLSSSGYHRLHVLCGESLRSETAIWLKIATTAIVVAMIEAGLKPGNDLELASPLNALRTVAADTECRQKLKLAGRRTASAIEIQRQYLKLAELHKDHALMPPWTESACLIWRQILDLLEEGPANSHRMLDWTIKQALYRHHLQSRGVLWEKIHAWNKAADRLRTALNEKRRFYPLRPELIIGPNSPVLETVAELTPYIREKGLRWDELEAFLQLKQEMFEIDTRFGQIGDNGVFQSLDRAGMLDHRIDGVDSIERAMSHPPNMGRAKTRGEIVRRLAGQGEKYWCTWQAICDQDKRTVFDLSDPFAVKEVSIPTRKPDPARESSPLRRPGPSRRLDPPRRPDPPNDNQRELPFADDIDPLLGQFLRMRRRSL